ncbi:hypothetical protein STAS_24053 [Striga asiatica]|uniref:Uncharacterized protein n=1 Tax=Striga asiatica TaxID=4170 RepID=A0A5A7QP02_STRAF|nr:hypothetical protein STAS_24053 [Striga asiatica]
MKHKDRQLVNGTWVDEILKQGVISEIDPIKSLVPFLLFDMSIAEKQVIKKRDPSHRPSPPPLPTVVAQVTNTSRRNNTGEPEISTSRRKSKATAGTNPMHHPRADNYSTTTIKASKPGKKTRRPGQPLPRQEYCLTGAGQMSTIVVGTARLHGGEVHPIM